MKVCISCQKDVEGKPAAPVREDRIIRGIRKVKTVFGVAQNNQLFVCQACLPKHIERRKGFEKGMLFASVFSGLILVILIVAIILSGRFEPWAVVSAFIICGFILLMPIFFQYAPSVDDSGMPAPAPPMISPPPSSAQAQTQPKATAEPTTAEKKKKTRKK
ncbi:MAG: hypothetical protein U0R44_06885 [Candidatus Micrarchaeia archaeon]